MKMSTLMFLCNITVLKMSLPCFMKTLPLFFGGKCHLYMSPIFYENVTSIFTKMSPLYFRKISLLYFYENVTVLFLCHHCYYENVTTIIVILKKSWAYYVFTKTWPMFIYISPLYFYENHTTTFLGKCHCQRTLDMPLVFIQLEFWSQVEDYTHENTTHL